MSCHAMSSCHAGTLGARPPARSAARSTALASHLQNSELCRAAAAPGRAERPLQHSNALVSTSVSSVAGHRWQQHSGTATAALPVAAEPDTAVSDAGVSDSGAAGVTADEPVPAAEQSSASVEPEAAAADAAAQAEQLAADAEAATGDATSADAAAVSPPASEGDTTEATRAAAAAVREAAARPKPSAQGRKQHPKQKHKVVQRKPPQRRQQDQEQNVHEPPGPVAPVPQEDRWFRAGDVVPCKVEWSNARGARVSTLRDPRIIGYMPAKEGPYHLRTENELHDTPPHQKQEGWAAPILPPGLVREFQVLKVPQDMEYNGRGPLLSARLVDLDTLWARAEQALRACRHGKETMRVRFLELNEGGLMARFLGLRLFMPLSHLAREEPGKFVPAEELEQKYLQGALTEVAITEVDAFYRRFVCSENLGLENAAIRRLQTGSLVWGTVRRVEDFGAFVGFDDTRASGLIHISNISRQHVEYTEEVFKLGDRVRAVVLSAEDNYTRFSLSTAELEERPGDMLRDREKVYETAEEQVKIFLELQAEAAAEDAAYGATDAPRDSEILASGHY